MELFNAYRNKSICAFMIIAERIGNGEVFSKLEFEAEYFRLSGDEKRLTEVLYENVIGNDKLQIFDFSDNKHVKLSEIIRSSFSHKREPNDIHISYNLLKTEKIWLNTALNDKLRNLFFSDADFSELGFDFSEYPLYYNNIDDEWRINEDISDDSANNFRTILQAINAKKTVSYVFNGKSCEGTPLKLEYDERKCKIYMIIDDGKRLIKSDISKLSSIQVNSISPERITTIEEAMNHKKTGHPVIFTVTDHKNRKAIERALLAFSVYDHVVEPIDERTAKFTIQYYNMDLDLLIKDILAFGSDIVVESPKIVVNKIIEILEKV